MQDLILVIVINYAHTWHVVVTNWGYLPCASTVNYRNNHVTEYPVTIKLVTLPFKWTGSIFKRTRSTIRTLTLTLSLTVNLRLTQNLTLIFS